MARLFGAQRMVLQALLDAQGDSQAFIEDSRISQATKISLRDMRDWFLTLDHDELVDLALTESGLSASVTPKVVWLLVSIDHFRRRPRHRSLSHPGHEARPEEKGRWSSASAITLTHPPGCPPSPMTCVRWRPCSVRTRGSSPAQNVVRLTDEEATSDGSSQGDRDDLLGRPGGRRRVCLPGRSRGGPERQVLFRRP